MAYLKYSELEKRAKRLDEGRIVTASRQIGSKSIFLSHSSKDESKLAAVIDFLEEHSGANTVYIDENDPRLPKTTTPVTAAKLKTQIGSSRKFVMLLSPASKDSRWVPWELGLADPQLKPSNIAILPIQPDAELEGWADQEYLGLYPLIKEGQIKGKAPGWIVLNVDGTGWTLRDWIQTKW